MPLPRIRTVRVVTAKECELVLTRDHIAELVRKHFTRNRQGFGVGVYIPYSADFSQGEEIAVLVGDKGIVIDWDMHNGVRLSPTYLTRENIISFIRIYGHRNIPQNVAMNVVVPYSGWFLKNDMASCTSSDAHVIKISWTEN